MLRGERRLGPDREGKLPKLPKLLKLLTGRRARPLLRVHEDTRVIFTMVREGIPGHYDAVPHSTTKLQ